MSTKPDGPFYVPRLEHLKPSQPFPPAIYVHDYSRGSMYLAYPLPDEDEDTEADKD
jgi:hypothetical protein